MDKKRCAVPFDTEFFKKLSDDKGKLIPKEIFTKIYETNHWGGNYSVSGEGSDDAQTAEIRKYLPQIIKKYKIKSFLDLPCGDFNWMNNVNLKVDRYIGADIVEEIIDRNQHTFGNENREFLKLNLIEDELPKFDLIFCRDCFVHLSNKDVLKAIKNIKNAGIKYIFTTTFTECNLNKEITTGDWRIINLEKEPFLFPQPLLFLNENCTEGNGTYSDKSLGLWEISSIVG